MSNHNTYSEPVQSLLTLGKADWQEWDDYLALGFTRDHIPDLVHMATVRYLIVEAVEPEFWAPIHAWRALAQLEAKEERATPSRIKEVIAQKYPALRALRERFEKEEQ